MEYVVDDPLVDLNYILLRLQKFIGKAEYWLTMTDLSEEEIDEISAYASRIWGLIDEFERELVPEHRTLNDPDAGIADERERVLIFDFALEFDERRARDEKLDSLFHEVLKRTELVRREDYLKKLRRHNLRQAHNHNNRGRKIDGSHRDRKNRAKPELTVTIVKELSEALTEINVRHKNPKSHIVDEALWRFIFREFPGIAQETLQ